MRQVTLGTLLLLANACRTDQPPPTPFGVGDGVGGAKVTEADGSHKYYLPSELKGAFVIPDPNKAAAFMSWCYGTSPEEISAKIKEFESKNK